MDFVAMGKITRTCQEMLAGDRISDVFHIHRCDEAGTLIGKRAFDEMEVIIPGAARCLGRITLDDGQLGGLDRGMVIFADERTVICTVPDAVECPLSNYVEIFAGFGGMGLAARYVGGKVVAAVDWNKLSTQQLRQHGVEHVLEADVADENTIKEFHLRTEGCKLVALMGFPCQPHSRQGTRGGFSDPRAELLWNGLRAIYLLQCEAAVLECVCQAGQDPMVMQAVNELALLMGWSVQCIELELGQQWPNNRRRWWALLRKPEWSSQQLYPWTQAQDHQEIGTIFNGWKQWDECEEAELALTAEEKDAYDDPRFGLDRRQLDMRGKVATLLHSYGNAMRGCPCGCRRYPFSSVLQKGLRGCYVHSSRTGAPRFLHPEEMALLLGVDPHATRTGNMREQLCQLGLIASPMQCLWVLARLLIDYDVVHGHKPSFSAPQIIATYKNMLLRSNDKVHNTIKLIQTCEKGEVSIVQIEVEGECRLDRVLKAESIFVEWGERLSVQEVLYSNDRADEISGIEIERVAKKQKKCAPNREIVIFIYGGRSSRVCKIQSGSFLFQCFEQLGICPEARVLTAEGNLITPGFRVWYPASFNIADGTRFPRVDTSHLLRGSGLKRAEKETPPAEFAAQGITEVAIAREAEKIFREAQIPLRQLWTPKLIIKMQDTWSLLANALVKEKIGTDDFAAGILWDDGHWVTFKATWKGENFECTFYDGLRDTISVEMHAFAMRLARAKNIFEGHLEVKRIVKQTHGHHCGAIALLHLKHIVGNCESFTEEQAREWHRELVDDRGFVIRAEAEGDYSYDVSPTVQWHLIGSGLSNAQSRELAKLLCEKGVPTDESQNRAQEVISKLGSSIVAHALRAENPWQVLKTAANAPSTRMRLVLQERRLRTTSRRNSNRSRMSLHWTLHC